MLCAQARCCVLLEHLPGQTSACLSARKLYKENGRETTTRKQTKQLKIVLSALKERKGVRQITDEEASLQRVVEKP